MSEPVFLSINFWILTNATRVWWMNLYARHCSNALCTILDMLKKNLYYLAYSLYFSICKIHISEVTKAVRHRDERCWWGSLVVVSLSSLCIRTSELCCLVVPQAFLMRWVRLHRASTVLDRQQNSHSHLLVSSHDLHWTVTLLLHIVFIYQMLSFSLICTCSVTCEKIHIFCLFYERELLSQVKAFKPRVGNVSENFWQDFVVWIGMKIKHTV